MTVLLIFVSWLVVCSAQFVDEMQTYEAECLVEGAFTCLAGGCVPQDKYCDGSYDCEDGSDENFCINHRPDEQYCNDTHQFLCADSRKCLPSAWVCNDEPDCSDGSDELNCPTAAAIDIVLNAMQCKGFSCDGKRCISKFWRCDGYYDCDDKTDEDIQSTCAHVFRSKKLQDMYLHDVSYCEDRGRYTCLDKSFCLPPENMCNGMNDCKDGSDEGAFCQHWFTMCANFTCPPNAHCRPQRTGATCICDTYKRYNSTSKLCEESDHCAEEKPVCSHMCVNKGDHFQCVCDHGYTTDVANYLCFAPDPEALLFFNTRNDIRYVSVKSKHQVIAVTGVKQAHSVSYDGTYLYWVETAQGHQAIMRARLDDVKDSKQVIAALGIEDPGDIAIDYLADNIYFGDAKRGVISVCRSDGSVCTTLRTDAKHPRFVTLDPRQGKMYWVDWHNRDVIMQANMDGSSPTVLVDNLSSVATGLALDAPNGRLYYVDQTIKVVRLEDKRVYPFFEEPFHHPYSLAVFENTVFWSDFTSNTIQTTDKIHGTNINRNILLGLDVPVFDMHIYHPVLMNKTRNPCSQHQHDCQLCLLVSNSSHVCACPDDMQMVAGRCQQIPGYRPQYLIVGSGSTFTRVYYNRIGNPETHGTNLDIGRVQAMAYDSIRDALYVYDSQRKAISHINMSDFALGVTELLLYKGLENVVDMDYDFVSDTLYVLDAGRRVIEVLSLRNKHAALLYSFRDREIPLSFCVMSDYGRMLVAVLESEENNRIHIDSMGLDGSNREHLLMNNVVGPNVRLRYSPEMNVVYIADDGNRVIDVIHPEGSGREMFSEVLTSVASLAVSDTRVFWTDRRSARLYWANVHEAARSVHQTRRMELCEYTGREMFSEVLTSVASLAVSDTRVFWTDRRSARLYWANVHEAARSVHQTRRMELCEYTGREMFSEVLTSVASLAVSDTRVFWTDRRSARLYWANVHEAARSVHQTRRMELCEYTGREMFSEVLTSVASLAVSDTRVFWTDRRSARLYWANVHEAARSVHQTRRMELCEYTGREMFSEVLTSVASLAVSDTRVFWTDRRSARLYWANVHEAARSVHQTRRMELCEYTGREMFSEVLTSVASLAVSDTRVFWTDRRSARLYWANVHEAARSVHQTRRMELSIFPNETHLHILTTTLPPAPNNPYRQHKCFQPPTPCSHICVQAPHLPHNTNVSSMGYTCRCPPGFLTFDRCMEFLECHKDEFYCHKSVECFTANKKCDGVKDCKFGEDEEGCGDTVTQSPEMCPEDQTNCHGICIPKNHACDDHITSTSVVPVSKPIQCSTEEFRCSDNSVCIERSLTCDGHSDCVDGSDEHPDACDVRSCFETEFMCATGSCIPVSWRCDGNIDCTDDSDEVGCEMSACPTGSFACGNGSCVPVYVRCDGKADCADHADEQGCDLSDFIEVSEHVITCSPWEHPCEHNKTLCLPYTARCNGKVDCPGGTDEAGCDFHCGGVESSLFPCKQEYKCVKKLHVCNGRKDCSDGSDETIEACIKVNKTVPLHAVHVTDSCSEGYRCDSGQCVEWRQVCDNTTDCGDGSDEGRLCGEACTYGTCEQMCHATPRGRQCTCAAGYVAHGSTCRDVDECPQRPCSQVCHNVPGSFVCACHKGYALRADRRSCKAVLNKLAIIYTLGSSIWSMTNHLHHWRFRSGEGDFSDLDVDVRNKKVYVTSSQAKKLFQFDLLSGQDSAGDGITNIGIPNKMALDWVTGNVYFVDETPGASCVRVCNFQARRCAALQKLPSDKVTALAIDPASRLMFYCISGMDKAIVRSASLSGENVSDLANVSSCSDLEVDSFSQTVFIASEQPSRILQVGYFDKSRKIVLIPFTKKQNVIKPRDIALFEDHIYILSNTHLNRCTLFDTTACETYDQLNATNFAIRHQTLQRDDITNECEAKVCSNVCVLGPSGPQCVCHDGSTSSDGTCPWVKTSELALFNGWTYQEYKSHSVSYALVASVLLLFALYLCVFVYWHFIKKRKPDYMQVRYKNAPEGVTHTPSPFIEMPDAACYNTVNGTAHEFVNPLQFVRNYWQESFNKKKPIGTAGLAFETQQNFSDTESDLDVRETKRMLSNMFNQI